MNNFEKLDAVRRALDTLGLYAPTASARVEGGRVIGFGARVVDGVVCTASEWLAFDETGQTTQSGEEIEAEVELMALARAFPNHSADNWAVVLGPQETTAPASVVIPIPPPPPPVKTPEPAKKIEEPAKPTKISAAAAEVERIKAARATTSDVAKTSDVAAHVTQLPAQPEDAKTEVPATGSANETDLIFKQAWAQLKGRLGAEAGAEAYKAKLEEFGAATPELRKAMPLAQAREFLAWARTHGLKAPKPGVDNFDPHKRAGQATFSPASAATTKLTVAGKPNLDLDMKINELYTTHLFDLGKAEEAVAVMEAAGYMMDSTYGGRAPNVNADPEIKLAVHTQLTKLYNQARAMGAN